MQQQTTTTTRPPALLRSESELACPLAARSRQERRPVSTERWLLGVESGDAASRDALRNGSLALVRSWAGLVTLQSSRLTNGPGPVRRALEPSERRVRRVGSAFDAEANSNAKSLNSGVACCVACGKGRACSAQSPRHRHGRAEALPRLYRLVRFRYPLLLLLLLLSELSLLTPPGAPPSTLQTPMSGSQPNSNSKR